METKVGAKRIVVTPSLKQKIKKLAERNQLALVMLFGSQSYGDIHADSDVDIAYQAESPFSPEQEVMLNYQFTEVFGTDRVDTVDIVHASPLLNHQILDQAIVLYDKTGFAFPVFELHTLRSFVEAKSLFDIRREKIQAFAHAT